jgi:hypothetical protein
MLVSPRLDWTPCEPWPGSTPKAMLCSWVIRRGVAIDGDPGSVRGSRSGLGEKVGVHFEEIDLQIIYSDGMHFGEQCALAATATRCQVPGHVMAWTRGSGADSLKGLRAVINAVYAHRLDVPRLRGFFARHSQLTTIGPRPVWGESGKPFLYPLC